MESPSTTSAMPQPEVNSTGVGITAHLTPPAFNARSALSAWLVESNKTSPQLSSKLVFPFLQLINNAN